MDKLLGLLGLAYRGRKLQIGEQPVLQALLKRRAYLVLAASDAGENTVGRITARAGDTPVRRCNYDKSTFGSAFGRQSCAVAAVCDRALAAEITVRLTDGEHFGGGLFGKHK